MSVEHTGNGTRLAVGPGVAKEGPFPGPRAGDAAKRRGGGAASGSTEGCAVRGKIDRVQRDTPPLERRAALPTSMNSVTLPRMLNWSFTAISSPPKFAASVATAVNPPAVPPLSTPPVKSFVTYWPAARP